MYILVLVVTFMGVEEPSKLRLGLPDENTERNFCLNHFLGDRSLFVGVDMGGKLR